MTTRLVGTVSAVTLGAATTAVGAAEMPADATLPTLPDGVAFVASGMLAEATLPPGLPPLLPNLIPSPMPVEPGTPWGAMAGPLILPYSLPMAAMVAGPLALGFGMTPKVWPRCTGAVEGLTWLSCAGMAAGFRAVLGCGASMTEVLDGLMAGIATLASIFTSGNLGSGLGLGIAILGASSFSSGSWGISCAGGGGGTLALILGGVFGTIICVCSLVCASATFFL